MHTNDHIPAEHLVALVDGDLDASGIARVRLHLEQCARCEQHVADLTALDARVARAWPQVRDQAQSMPPARLVAALQARLSVLLNAHATAPPRVPLPRPRARHALVLLAAAALVLATIPLSLPSRSTGLLGSSRVRAYSPPSVLRGAGERRFYVELELEQPAYLALLLLTAQGNVTPIFPHPLWGSFGLGEPLPASVSLRLPPSPLQDELLPSGSELLVIPSARPFREGIDGLAAAVRREQVAAAPAADRRQQLRRWLGEHYPGARIETPGE
ncbi:MAG: zf-HC2 domain-containing protein [Planctomycetota bacterium]